MLWFLRGKCIFRQTKNGNGVKNEVTQKNYRKFKRDLQNGKGKDHG